VKRGLLIACVAVLSPAAVVLYRIPPTQGSFYPSCAFHAMTGLNCPGCGATRCLHAVLHGDFRQAVAYNAMLVLALPFLALAGARFGYETWTGRHLPIPRLPAWFIRLLFVLIVCYWIARNIDFYPFNMLAPHEL